MHKTYVFRTPSNQKIEVESGTYSFFREIITIGDLKVLFMTKLRLYSMDSFELAFLNKATKQTEILNHDLKLSDLQIDEYLIIHIDLPKANKPEVDTVIETCVKTLVEKIADKIVDPVIDTEKSVVTSVEKVVEEVVDTVVETVIDPVVEKVENVIDPVLEKVENVIDPVVEKVVIDLVEDMTDGSLVEKARDPIAEKADEEEKDVKKKFCIIC